MDASGANHERSAGRASLSGRGSPSRWLEPILARIERIDRRRRRIRAIRSGGLVGIELRRHAGEPVILGDGVRVESGDVVGELHLDNARLHTALVGEGREMPGWGWFERGRTDLRALARWADGLAAGSRPIAYRAGGVVAPLAARLGFDIHPRRAGWLGWLEGWYLRGIMARWAIGGRTRLQRGRGQLEPAEAWLSHRSLEALYGSGAPLPRAQNGRA